MPNLGQQNNGGGTFTVSSTFGDFAGGSYTVPSPGIIVTKIWAYVGNNGTSENLRLYVWQDSSGKPGTWLIRGASTQSLAGLGWNSQSSLASNGAAGISNQFLPGGTVVWIGAYCSAGTEQFAGNAASGGGTELGNTADGNWNDHGAASYGQVGAYVEYTLAGGAWINTGTPAAPVWTASTGVFVNTGTPASPVWTQATQVAANTGTPASPVWTPAS